jgi:hypothetical protein
MINIARVELVQLKPQVRGHIQVGSQVIEKTDTFAS